MEELEVKIILDPKEFECTLDTDSVIYSQYKICNSYKFIEYPEEETWMKNEYITNIYRLSNENKNITIKVI